MTAKIIKAVVTDDGEVLARAGETVDLLDIDGDNGYIAAVQNVEPEVWFSVRSDNLIIAELA